MKFYLSIILVFSIVFVTAQQTSSYKYSYKPIKINLSEDGNQYVRFMTWLQMWGTSIQNNPGTVGYDNKALMHSETFAIRRARFLAYTQLGQNWLLLAHVGINNQTFNSGGNNGVDGKKPQLFIHDAWTEYVVIPKKLNIGSGIHYWNGVSRLANASTISFMTLDAPIFNWYTIETNDQFCRQMGVYAKGQIHKFDYRVALNKPFLYGVNPYTQTAKTTNGFNTVLAAKNAYSNSFSTAGYFKYMFKETESDLLPFEAGTYLGEKKVFNIGAGFYHHPKSNYTLNPGIGNDSLKLYATTVVGADVFYDAPLGKRGYAISLYGLYQRSNYGPNYLRTIGVLNTCTTVGTAMQLGKDYSNRSVLGAGNFQPTIGTGDIAYLQAGIRLPKFKNGHSLMPYLTVTSKQFEATGSSSLQFDVGANYFISGHNAKITAQYGTRPIYKFDASSKTGIIQNGLKGQFTIQSQIFL